MLDGANDEALLAVDLYNQPERSRRLEGFLIHMHIAWLYLLHAEFRRDGVDYHYRMPNGWYERSDGEPKTWDLSRSAKERWPSNSAVRTNLELTIALRNKIEHRYQEAIVLATSGYAQALLLNYEEELTSTFGSEVSLGRKLRFPIFVSQVTTLGETQVEELRGNLPKTTRDFLARFESDLDPSIVNDQRYEFRINLVPKLGPKSEADLAISFVRETDLSDKEKTALQSLGRTGSVVVRERVRQVSSAGLMKPSTVVTQVQARIPFVFNMRSFVAAWKKLECRPPGDAAHPERTEERYCVYDEPHRDYLYKPAFVEKIVRETSTVKKYAAFLGYLAKRKTE
jgi:hypothetical protein